MEALSDLFIQGENLNLVNTDISSNIIQLFIGIGATISAIF